MYTSKYNFRDTEFMSANEKEKVLRDWKKFLQALLNNYESADAAFTKRLYDHLHLHCGYIAHYNINGFYQTYFSKPKDTLFFFKQWDDPVRCARDYDDINTAMQTEFLKLREKLYVKFMNMNKKEDILEAKRLLEKWNIKQV